VELEDDDTMKYWKSQWEEAHWKTNPMNMSIIDSLLRLESSS
jgi:hypothetical protein